MHTQTEKTTFHAKTTSAKLYIYIGVGARDLYIDEAHMALGIFRFALFFNLDASLMHGHMWRKDDISTVKLDHIRA